MRLIAEILRHRYLLATFVRRQYQLRYRQSAAGILWAFVAPVMLLVTATIVFDRVARVDTGDAPYTLFVLAGLVPWTFFASSLTFGVPSVVSAQTMVSRLPFPRSVLPIGMIGTALLDLVVSLLLFLGFSVGLGEGIPATAIAFPVLLLIEMVLVLGLVLVASALNVFARDLRFLVPLVVQLWLFLTPVMYPLSAVPDRLRVLYDLNPMTGLVEGSRALLVYGEAPDPSILIPAAVGALLAFAIGTWYFGAVEDRFADVV